MKAMTYQGYSARIEYGDEDGCFVGHIAGINDVVGFHGDSVAKLRARFTGGNKGNEGTQLWLRG